MVKNLAFFTVMGLKLTRQGYGIIGGNDGNGNKEDFQDLRKSPNF